MSPSTHSADVSQIQTDTAAILVDTGTTIPATIATVDTVVDSILVDSAAILVDTGTTIPTTLDLGMVSGSSIYKDAAVTTTATSYTGLWTIILGGNFTAGSTFYASFIMYAAAGTSYGRVYVNAGAVSDGVTNGGAGKNAYNVSFTADPGDKIQLYGYGVGGNTVYFLGFAIGGNAFGGDTWNFA